MELPRGREEGKLPEACLHTELVREVQPTCCLSYMPRKVPLYVDTELCFVYSYSFTPVSFPSFPRRMSAQSLKEGGPLR